MVVIADFSFQRWEDAILNVSLSPPLAIGGMQMRCLVQHRFGGISGLIVKTVASGYAGGQSGFTFLNSGVGQMQVNLNSPDTSGWDPLNFAFLIERLDSGFRTELVKGHVSIGEGGTL